MPTLRAEFSSWELADQALTALKHEAIPVRQVRLSEHQNYLALYSSTNPSGLAPSLSENTPASINPNSTPFHSQAMKSPVLVELQVDENDWQRAEALLHKWRAGRLYQGIEDAPRHNES